MRYSGALTAGALSLTWPFLRGIFPSKWQKALPYVLASGKYLLAGTSRKSTVVNFCRSSLKRGKCATRPGCRQKNCVESLLYLTMSFITAISDVLALKKGTSSREVIVCWWTAEVNSLRGNCLRLRWIAQRARGQGEVTLRSTKYKKAESNFATKSTGQMYFAGKSQSEPLGSGVQVGYQKARYSSITLFHTNSKVKRTDAVDEKGITEKYPTKRYCWLTVYAIEKVAETVRLIEAYNRDNWRLSLLVTLDVRDAFNSIKLLRFAHAANRYLRVFQWIV